MIDDRLIRCLLQDEGFALAAGDINYVLFPGGVAVVTVVDDELVVITAERDAKYCWTIQPRVINHFALADPACFSKVVRFLWAYGQPCASLSCAG